MHLLETNRTGRVYQSTDLYEAFKFAIVFGGEFSSDFYEDWLKGIYTIVI